MSVIENANTPPIDEIKKQTPPSDIKYIQVGNATFELEMNYTGTLSLLDVVKTAIKQDIESGNY